MDNSNVPRLISPLLLERNPLIAHIQRNLVRPSPVPRTESFWNRRQIGGEHPLLRQMSPRCNFFRSVEIGEVVELEVAVPEAGHVRVVGPSLGVELDTQGEECRNQGHCIRVLDGLHTSNTITIEENRT